MPSIAPMKKPPMPTRLTAENTIMTVAQIMCSRGCTLNITAPITTITHKSSLTAKSQQENHVSCIVAHEIVVAIHHSTHETAKSTKVWGA